MIFAIPSYTQAPCFDRGKAEPDGLAQCGSVDVRDPILITNSPVREIQSLTGDIPIRIGGIVGRQPVKDSNFPNQERQRVNLPSLYKDLLCAVRCARCRGGADVGSELLESMVGTQRHASKCAGGMDSVLTRNDVASGEHGRVVCGGA